MYNILQKKTYIQLFLRSILLPTSLHYRKLLFRSASHRILHVVREVTLQHTHPTTLVVSQCVCSQMARLASVNHSEVLRLEAVAGVPSVDLGFAFVTEKHGQAIVRADGNQFVRFDAHI